MSDSLYDAAVYGDYDGVRRILAQNPGTVHEVDEYGFTALHGVAGEHHPEMAQLLIDHGANVNAANDEGVTPLHLAAWPEMVAVLLRNGADLEARDRRGDTPLLTQAAEPESEDVMEALLQAGADVEARNADGESAMDLALAREEDEKVDLLESFAVRETD